MVKAKIRHFQFDQSGVNRRREHRVGVLCTGDDTRRGHHFAQQPLIVRGGHQ